MKLLLFVISFYTFTVALFISHAYSETYRFVDESGVLHLTDRPVKNRIIPIYNGQRERVGSYLGTDRVRSNIKKDDLFLYEIEKASKIYGIDSLLIKSVIKEESNFNPAAVSKKGALGLMQLIPKTASLYNVEEPFDPEQNINGGAQYLKYLFKLFDGDLIKTLAAYNAGEDAVIKYNGVPPYKETKRYVAKVINTYTEYKRAYRPSIFKYKLKDGTILYTDSPNPLLHALPIRYSAPKQR